MTRRRACAWALAISAGIAHPGAGYSAAAALTCQFHGGFEAHYRLSPDRAGVRRIDVAPSRWGRVEADARTYRFIFDGGLEHYRIVVVIDRATGDARRVYGSEAAMARPFAEPAVGAERVVRESGRCNLAERDRIDG